MFQINRMVTNCWSQRHINWYYRTYMNHGKQLDMYNVNVSNVYVQLFCLYINRTITWFTWKQGMFGNQHTRPTSPQGWCAFNPTTNTKLFLVRQPYYKRYEAKSVQLGLGQLLKHETKQLSLWCLNHTPRSFSTRYINHKL